MAPLNVGFVAYGFATKSFHLPFVIPNPDLKVYAFLQRSGNQCKIDFPEAQHYKTSDEFFADPKIDLVIVCTHHDTHAEFAEKALLSGKHVVVEKPFTVNTEEADRVIAAGKKSGKILTVFQNRRYDSDFRTLHHLVKNSIFGEITECEIHYDVDFPNWIAGWKSPDYSPGQGMMFGLGSHTIDQALLLFGKPKIVTGFYRSLRGVESKTDDTFTIILQYSGNLLVTVKTTVVSMMQHPLKYFIRGYDGSFIKYGDDKQESQISAGMTTASEGFGVEEEEIHGVLTTKKQFHEGQKLINGKWTGKFPSLKGDYEGYYKDLVKAIRGGELVVKPEESRDGIKVIELARESAEKGHSLPFN